MKRSTPQLNPRVVQRNKAKLRQAVRDVLAKNKDGIEKNNFWNIRELQRTLPASSYGVERMNDLFIEFKDFVEEFSARRTSYVRLKQASLSIPQKSIKTSSDDTDDFPVLSAAGPGTKNSPHQSSYTNLLKQDKNKVQNVFSYKNRAESLPNVCSTLSMSPSKDRDKISQNLDKLKDKVIKLFRKFEPHGVKKKTFWEDYTVAHCQSPVSKDYGVAKMSDVFQLFSDIIEEYQKSGETYLCLKKLNPSDAKVQPSMKWGQGAVAPSPGIGRTSRQRQVSSSSSSSLESVEIVTSQQIQNTSGAMSRSATNRKNHSRPEQETTVDGPTQLDKIGVHDTTKQRSLAPGWGSPASATGIVPLRPLMSVPLRPVEQFAFPVYPMSPNMQQWLPSHAYDVGRGIYGIQSTAFHSSAQQFENRCDSRSSTPDFQHPSGRHDFRDGRSSGRSDSHFSSRDESRGRYSSQERSQSRDRMSSPVSRSEGKKGPESSRNVSSQGPGPGNVPQRKEITVSPVSLPRGSRPPHSQMDSIAKDCIDILADANEFVSQERIEKLFCQRFMVGSLRDLGLRYIDQLPSVKEHMRLLCKVNAAVQAFVKARSICSIHELSENLRDFAQDRAEFESLHLGPLQKLPIIYEMFKFPSDGEILEITTVDILQHLQDYMSKHNKWTEKLEMEEVMNYLVEAYHVEDAYALGVRIRSLPLAAQMLKKGQRDAATTRRSVVETFKEEVKKDVAVSFHKFKAAILQHGDNGESEVRSHYLQLSPEVAIMQIFQKFQLLLSIDTPTSHAERKRHLKLQSIISDFLLTVRDDRIAKLLFHIAICVSNSVLEESAAEMLTQPASGPVVEDSAKTEPSSAPFIPPPSLESLLEKLQVYLDRCIAHGAVSLAHLVRIEEKLLEDFRFSSFQSMGYGQFLNFLVNKPAAKSMMEEYGGTTLGSSSGSHDSDYVYRPDRTGILEFIRQCQKAGLTQHDPIETAVRSQFCVSDTKHLGQGNIAIMVAAAEKPGKHQDKEYKVLYEASLCGKNSQIPRSQTKVGILGYQPKESALLCLHNCPLLENLAEWCHWSLVFEPQHGKLKDFVQKYGGVYNFSIEGGRKSVTTDILALEAQPGVLMKLVSQTSSEKYETALRSGDVAAACGHLVSLVVVNKGVENFPLALLSNYTKTALFAMHAESSSLQTPGAPPHGHISDPAVQFVLECLSTLPIRMCVALANQVFLEPLGQVVGSTKSKSLLLEACKSSIHQRKLEKLGFLLGVQEWTQGHSLRCQPPEEAVIEVISAAEAKEFLDDDEEMDDYEDDFETESESDSESSITSILSDEDDVDQKREVEVEKKKESDELEKNMNKEKDDEIEKATEAETEETPSEDEKDEDGDDDDDDDDDDSSSADDRESSLEKQVNQCRIVIEQIRREEFGIGIELNEDGQKLMKVQQERLGRSLDRLSKDLYSKDTHFVLELVQNADDNAYPEAMLTADADICPSVKFVMTTEGVTVMNNECGFREKDIKALCDVGRSTKGKHKFGYIGQKGIGFKSVFRITDCPEVHSNGYHICFDVKSGPMGYILPHWLDDKKDCGEDWVTKIILPLKTDMSWQTRSLAARFNDIHPSLLLFLHRLRQITIENKIEQSVVTMRRRDLGGHIIEIDHGGKVDRWLVIKKMLDASSISLQAKSGVDVESTEIAIAFPMKPRDQKLRSQVLPAKQPVFAFLPLRSYGFRFVIQGDFDVPSSREDVDRDSPWNQWLRNEIHLLFIESLEVFKIHPDFSNMEALSAFLQFVPMEDEVLDFFRPVATHILQKLRAKECLPVQTGRKGSIQWKIPSQTVIVKDHLIKEVISPEHLQKNLNLFYLHGDVAAMLNQSLAQSLGVEVITVDHLLSIGKSLSLEWDTSDSTDKCDKVLVIAKWLACLYRSLDDFQQNDSILDSLKSLRIIPLSTGQLVSLQETTVFLPPADGSAEKKNLKGRRDPLAELQRDLNMIHLRLVTTQDNEVNSQVQKLLQRIGVKQLSPYDIIHHHIMPVLKSDDWQNKSRDVLISYIVYIKEQHERQSSLINITDLKSCARVVTSHGIKKPSEDAVHFSPAYGNKIDLQRSLPGYSWILLDSVYLIQATQAEIQRWHMFFSELGVTDFLLIKQEDVHFTKDSMAETPWAPLQEMWRDSSEGFYISDFSCEEFHSLVTKNKDPNSFEMQLGFLFEILDRDWDRKFSKFTNVQVKDKTGHEMHETESSFSIYLRTLKWVPAIQKSLITSGGNLCLVDNETVMQPSTLYVPAPNLMKILGHTVLYLAPKVSPQSSFARFLKIKMTVDIDDVTDLLVKQGKRSAATPSEPQTFSTCLAHLKAIYQYLSENLVPKKAQDLFHLNPVIFVPDMHPQDVVDIKLVTGKMLMRDEIWWNDPTGLIMKHRQSLVEYHSPLASRFTVAHLYKGLEEIFKSLCRIQHHPSPPEYAELLIIITTINSPNEPSILSDILKIQRLIGNAVLQHDRQEEDYSNERALFKQDILKIVKVFKKQKIFATKKDTWVSTDDKPMIADNKELEKMFADQDGVHFLQLEERIAVKDRNLRSRNRDAVRQDLDAVMAFVDLFRIPKLSDCVKMEDTTEMYQPCLSLQRYMHDVVPIIQCYLQSHFCDIYQHLLENNIAADLKALVFIQVGKLEVIYSLKDNESARVVRPEKCIRSGKQFYFHKSHINSFSDINREIAKYFGSESEECVKSLRSFLAELTPVVHDQRSVIDLMSRHDIEVLPPEEEKWEVPPPVIPVAEPEQVVPLAKKEESSPGSQNDADGGEKTLKSWPPQSDFSTGERTAKKASGDSKPLGNKVWPPPKPPEYLQQVKELPSNIRVARQQSENTESAESPKDGSREEKGGKAHPRSCVSGVAKQDSTEEGQDGKRGYERQFSSESVRHHGGGPSGEIRKRKLSGGQVDSEAKRPTQEEDVDRPNPEAQENPPHQPGEVQRVVLDDADDNKQDQAAPGASKRRHLTSESEQSSAKQPVFFKAGDPLWGETASELLYEELGSGSALKIPQSFSMDDSEKTELPEIGRWGELVVYDYLMQQKAFNHDITDIIWLNEQEETGLPFDFEVILMEDDEKTSLYIEVKSTISDTKQQFEISSREVQFAMEHRDKYQIYRIFSAGNAKKVKLVRIENIALKMDQGAIKLFMYI